MKRFTRLISLALLTVFIVVGVFGCYGNMALTKKVYQYNGNLGDKYLVQIAFWVMNFVPVYSAAAFIDVAFLNVIEFWTGSNPMAMNAGDQVIKYAQNGDKTLQFKITQNKMIITETAGPNSGAQIELSYNPTNNSWYLNDKTSTQKIATVDGEKLNLIYPSGKELAINLAK
ncbi:MAG: DUF3332 family protein [Candidatus Cloacimonas sp.]|jgi:hypothetical protein|nr:DUF3332 family protein [Candidatus Cloacimonas sp.]